MNDSANESCVQHEAQQNSEVIEQDTKQDNNAEVDFVMST